MIKNLVKKYNLKNGEFEFPIKIEGFEPFNTSIIKTDKGINLYTRYSNFTVCNNIYADIEKTKNFLIISKLDKSLKIKESELFFIDKNYMEDGVEDIRVFNYRGDMYMIGTISNEETGVANMSIIKNKRIIHIFSRDKKLQGIQKNWAPIIIKGKLYFIAYHNPLILVKVNLRTGEAKIEYEGEKQNITNIRGSTPYIYLGDDKYLSITHTANYNYEIPKYLHYFTIFNSKTKKIEKISKPICFFGKCGIEFVMGLIEDKNNYIVTLGISDCSANYIKIPKNIVYELLDLKL